MKVIKVKGKKSGFVFEQYPHFLLKEGRKTLGSFDSRKDAETFIGVLK